MGSDGTLIKLGELVAHKKGFAFKSVDYQSTGIPVVRVSNFTDNSISPDDLKFVSEEVASKNPEVALTENDIVVATVGSWPTNPASVVGRTISVPAWASGALMNQNSVTLRARSKNQVDQRFLYFCMKSADFATHAVSKAQGSANQASITLDAIFSFPVWWPDSAARQDIVAILDSLDSRINLLRETNATLEAIAQTLFKSWFVDFDPVRAKMEGRAPEGMDEATAALFPDGLEESELGAVPRGWFVLQLDEIAKYLNGLALQKFPPTGSDDIPVIKIAQLRKGNTMGADKASRNMKPEYVIQDGDVLFSWSGSLEVEIWCGGEGALNQHLFKVTSAEYPKWFYYLWTRHYLEHFRQVAASKATTMGHIQRCHLSSAKVNVPPASVLFLANNVMRPIIDCVIENSLQARNLEMLRDTLLPRLISGQSRLPEVETVIESAILWA